MVKVLNYADILLTFSKKTFEIRLKNGFIGVSL